MLVAWLGLTLGCTDTGSSDSGATTAPPEPSWTQVQLDCVGTDHSWTAYATGLHGHAELRLVPATTDGVSEAHPLVVQDADPAGTWTLFAVDLEHDVGDVTTVPGRVSAHDCRTEGLLWTWALDLQDDHGVLACTRGEVADTGGVVDQVATCD